MNDIRTNAHYSTAFSISYSDKLNIQDFATQLRYRGGKLVLPNAPSQTAMCLIENEYDAPCIRGFLEVSSQLGDSGVKSFSLIAVPAEFRTKTTSVILPEQFNAFERPLNTISFVTGGDPAVISKLSAIADNFGATLISSADYAAKLTKPEKGAGKIGPMKRWYRFEHDNLPAAFKADDEFQALYKVVYEALHQALKKKEITEAVKASALKALVTYFRARGPHAKKIYIDDSEVLGRIMAVDHIMECGFEISADFLKRISTICKRTTLGMCQPG